MAAEELAILHATDIHCDYDRIHQLKEWLRREQQKVDVVFLSGDIANVPVEKIQTASKELQDEHYDNLQRITLEFMSVSDKVYFVPGNHDPKACYDISSDLPEEITFPINVHTRKVKIAPNLFLLGVGGSVPSYQEGKKLWEGFPYNSDDEFGKDLAKVLEPVVHQEHIPPAESYILMTHDGPNKSSTTEVRMPPAPVIIAGSDILYENLCKKKLQAHTVMNIHGHVHDCTGMATVGAISILNPGPLANIGHFGIYTVKKVPGRQPAWKLVCVSMHRLD